MPDMVLVALNTSYSHTNLAIRYLKQVADELALETICKEFTINEQISKIADELIALNSRVLGLSCYIWNYEFALKLTERLKLACPGLIIIFGGPQMIDCNEKWMNEHPEVDLVMVGAGEETFRKWCIQYQNGENNYNDIPGLWQRTPEGYIINNYVNNEGAVVLGSAHQGGEDLKNRLVYYETSRGCAYQCSYCLSSLDKRVRYRDLAQVKTDLGELAISGVQTVKLVDRTFNLLEARAREIIDYWCSLPVECCLHCEIVADIISDTFIEYLSQVPAGRVQFEIGLQSTNMQALKAVNRRMDWPRVQQVIGRLLAAHNIHIHLDLLVGLPHEDLTSFSTSFNSVYQLHPQHLQLGMLKILPGTVMKQQADNLSYRYTSYPPYELVSNPWLTALEVVHLHHLAETIDKLYNQIDLLLPHQFLLALYPSAFDYWMELANLAWQSGLLSTPHKNEAWFFLPVLLAHRDWGESVAREVEERIQFCRLVHDRHYHFNQPFTDRALPDRDYKFYREMIIEKWSQLKELNFKDFKCQVVIHRLPSLVENPKAEGLMAFLYSTNSLKCVDYFSW
ncbi:MAG: DUF4080 domain-containing protein [Methylocystaceae bacterium]